MEGKGFVEARKLARSDLLREARGTTARVEEVQRRFGATEVYNLRVAGTHTYYAAGVWVHNVDCACYDQARNQALEWLEARGFKAERPVLSRGLGDTEPGVPIGMQTEDGTLGFRVEYDDRNAAHINVWDYNAPKPLQKGPHFKFPRDESLVRSIIQRFSRAMAGR